MYVPIQKLIALLDLITNKGTSRRAFAPKTIAGNVCLIRKILFRDQKFELRQLYQL